jgi:glycosyltransferase involved in cell wall biosynthesis
MGHEVANFAWYGLQGSKLDAGVAMYPALPDKSELSAFGSNCIGAHVHDFGADVVISVHDIWTLPMEYAQRVKARRPGCRWISWLPVDHDPVPERVVELAETTDVAAVYSKWGAQRLREAGVEQAVYLPMGVDTSVFYPRDRQEARRTLGWPEEAFVAAMVAANQAFPSRKAYPEQLQAFRMFSQGRDDAYLYVHCDWTRAKGGVSVPTIADRLGIRRQMLFVDRYKYAMGLPEDYLANVYSAADVLLAASRTEGFGLPILEAQACGCPVITTRFASMPELTWNGITVPAVQLAWTPLQSWVSVPSVDGIWSALESIAMWKAGLREAEAGMGIESARAYSWDVVAEEHWGPLLGELEATGGRVAAAREARVSEAA